VSGEGRLLFSDNHQPSCFSCEVGLKNVSLQQARESGCGSQLEFRSVIPKMSQFSVRTFLMHNPNI